MSKAVIDSQSVKLAPDGVTVVLHNRPVGHIRKYVVDGVPRFHNDGTEPTWVDGAGEIHYSKMACAIAQAKIWSERGKL